MYYMFCCCLCSCFFKKGHGVTELAEQEGAEEGEYEQVDEKEEGEEDGEEKDMD